VTALAVRCPHAAVLDPAILSRRFIGPASAAFARQSPATATIDCTPETRSQETVNGGNGFDRRQPDRERQRDQHRSVPRV